MATKKKLRAKGLMALMLILALAGCMPAGPRALLDGKKLIEKGKYEEAVERLKLATALMETNALAWNYLGLAYQHADRLAEAIDAYQRALKRNPDLVEVHYDLGCALLEENRPESLEAAQSEFTAYTLRRSKSAQGWLKLGTAQLRRGELGDAERSFNEVRRIDPQNAEALNDLGVVLLRHKQAREAAAYFTSALREQPGYAPALLNLAMVSQAHLNNKKFALEKYEEYLALKPRPANWEAVNVAARELEQELNPPAAPPPTHPAPPVNVAKTQTNVPLRVAANNPPKPENLPRPEPAQRPPAPKPVPAPAPAQQPEAVQVAAAQPVKVANDKVVSSNDSAPASNPLPGRLLTERVDASQPADEEQPPQTPKRGFFQRMNPMNLFRREQKPAEATAAPPPPQVDAVSPPVEVSTNTQAASTLVARPAAPVRPLAVPRYAYKSPAKPPEGNRAEAERLVGLGVQAYRDSRLKDAVAAYRAAVRADASDFDAQSDLGLAEYDADELPQSLTAYETALAINPAAFNARFNFALALEKAGYIEDAAVELERLLAMSAPGKSPARLAMVHLTLANLYSEQFHRPAAARPHYLKVLELDPHNSQATAIRYWLRDNS